MVAAENFLALGGVINTPVADGQEKVIFTIPNDKELDLEIYGFLFKFTVGKENCILILRDGNNTPIIEGENQFCQFGNPKTAEIPFDPIPFKKKFPHNSKLVVSARAVNTTLDVNDVSMTLLCKKL
ncbi:MAG: hypothetical protein SFU98_07285 [Leptospiraceae bacterium]|nr:hypothetical protein [Leptospiraceae bacterium]